LKCLNAQHKFLSRFFCALLLINVACAEQKQKLSDNSDKVVRIQFVNEFIRELETLHRLQQTAAKELAEHTSPTGKLMTAVRVGTLTIMEITSENGRLETLKLGERWQSFNTSLQKLNDMRIEMNTEIVDGAKKLLSGPKNGVDYGAIMARAPELTAYIEQVDKGIFDISVPVALSLIDQGRIDKEGKLSYLILTEKQRAQMVKLLESIFGSKLSEESQNYIVSAASTLKHQLTRGLTPADTTN
jgi:hypothetical protein